MSVLLMELLDRYRRFRTYVVPRGGPRGVVRPAPIADRSETSQPAPEPSVEESLTDVDPGIRHAVQRLTEWGIEVFESCEGGPGHAYPEPTVAFYGAPCAGWHAVGVCLAYGLPVRSLRRVWDMLDANELTGPHWEIVLWPQRA